MKTIEPRRPLEEPYGPAGGPTEARRIDRQAHLVAGLILVAAFFLARTAGPAWIYLALLPTFGLLLDAATGVCPMTLILKKMPWNAR